MEWGQLAFGLAMLAITAGGTAGVVWFARRSDGGWPLFAGMETLGILFGGIGLLGCWFLSLGLVITAFF